MTYYVFVKKSDITQAMLNRSLSREIAKVPIYKVTTTYWWIFSFNTEFGILEIPEENFKVTTIFDSYPWLTCEQVHDKLKDFQQNGVA